MEYDLEVPSSQSLHHPYRILSIYYDKTTGSVSVVHKTQAPVAPHLLGLRCAFNLIWQILIGAIFSRFTILQKFNDIDIYFENYF